SWKNRGLSRDMTSVVHKATAKDPDERYQTASEFARDLQNVLNGTPVHAKDYRYLFSLSELIAHRPAAVVVACFGYILVALVSCCLIWLTTIQDYILNKHFLYVPLGVSSDPLAFTGLIINVLIAVWAGRDVLWGSPHAYVKAASSILIMIVNIALLLI